LREVNSVAPFAKRPREFAFENANVAYGVAVLSLKNVSPLMNHETPNAHSASVSSA
jgi:hypothetical protein